MGRDDNRDSLPTDFPLTKSGLRGIFFVSFLSLATTTHVFLK